MSRIEAMSAPKYWAFTLLLALPFVGGCFLGVLIVLVNISMYFIRAMQ